MLSRWESEIKKLAKEYEKEYGECGKVYLPASGHTYMNLWHAAVRKNTTVDELVRGCGYERVKRGEIGMGKKWDEIKSALSKIADEDNCVRVRSTGGLYKKIYNLARVNECSVDDIIEKCGYTRVRCSKFDKGSVHA